MNENFSDIFNGIPDTEWEKWKVEKRNWSRNPRPKNSKIEEIDIRSRLLALLCSPHEIDLFVREIILRRDKEFVNVTNGYHSGWSLLSEWMAGLEIWQILMDLNFFAKFDEELAQWDIQLSEQNGAQHMHPGNKATILQRMSNSEYIKIRNSMLSIERDARLKQKKLPEPENYRRAREAYKTMLDIVITRIAVWAILWDDETSSSVILSKIPRQ